MPNVFTFPLGYLSLTDEEGWPLYRRDLLGVITLALIVSLPFWVTSANYFGTDGFLDKFGAFSGVLTGFYVAALVSVASFLSASPSLDDLIAVGPIYGPPKAGAPNPFTRRQYICSMFGYLSFMSLGLSLGALLAVTISGPISWGLSATISDELVRQIISGALIFGMNLVLAHMVATTCHGLYYLIDRLYAEKAQILTKSEAKAAGLSAGDED